MLLLVLIIFQTISCMINSVISLGCTWIPSSSAATESKQNPPRPPPSTQTVSSSGILGIHDLFLPEFPRHLRFSDKADADNRLHRTRLTESGGRQARDWTLARLTDILNNSRLRSSNCQERALCQTAKYLRRLLPDWVRARFLANLPVDSFDSSRTYRNLSAVWKRSLSTLFDIPSRHLCSLIYSSCTLAQMDVNYVPLYKLKPFPLPPCEATTVRDRRRTVEVLAALKGEIPAETSPADIALDWILDQIEDIAFRSSNLSENCRVRAIARIAGFVHGNSSLGCAPEGAKCDFLTEKALIVRRVGANKFAEAWHNGIRRPGVLEREYPCKPKDPLEEDSLRRATERVIGFIRRRDAQLINNNNNRPKSITETLEMDFSRGHL